ncbi:MAG TPA: carboxypeptidase-like regulatory domain-containing protein [Pirellulaceae bacterium]|jgi:hypothetical protein|nr:carboxypeptidase-like regulatory domain-containing protein [Pirellulaceae bacterium]
MRIPRNLGSFTAALACINLLVPLQLLNAADPPSATTRSTARSAAQAASAQYKTTQYKTATPRETARPVTRDVTLGLTGELRGQLVDKNGVRLPNRIVVAVHADKSSLQSVSNANGQFHFPKARPGVYQVASQRSYQLCRCWAANTAPPAASKQLLMVEGDQTIRGQRPIGELLSGPVLIGLIIAAAIIIPIAVHNARKSAS